LSQRQSQCLSGNPRSNDSDINIYQTHLTLSCGKTY
jgi:hypothetical protein